MESIFNKVWRCIVEEEVGIVGLYGMGGVGKTKLLIDINNEILKSSHDFRVVIWVAVSKDVDFERIQNEIGKKLGFDDEVWRSKSQDEKGKDIFRVLKGMKFVLMLDDIWMRVDLLKLGVPLPQKGVDGSKLVFTTRSEDVCGKMEAHKKFNVECLPTEKAFELFKQKVGEDTLNYHPKLPKLAEIVADECKGLPLALITVGRAMSPKKTLEEWNHAISTLKRYAAEFSGMADEVFARLKFSYDSLPNEKLKFCFLYFSLFPEDYIIEKSDIIDHWMGEGVLGEIEDLNEARNRGYDIIGTLIHACLLDSEDEDHVKMHDVTRDMGLWITRECEARGKFLSQSRNCDDDKERESWKHVERLSLMKGRIEQLKVPINCPILVALLLTQCGLMTICSDFFQFMPNLRVLSMSYNSKLSELPTAISNLVSLEYLNLSSTGIRILPAELKNLKNLKILNLAYTTKLAIIPLEVLGSFHRLRALDMTSSGIFSEFAEGGGVLSGGSDALVDELECLELIQQLSIHLKSNSALKRFLKWQKFCDCTNTLELRYLMGSTSLDLPSLQNLKNLHRLAIRNCKDVEDFCVDWALEEGERINQNNFTLSEIRNNPCFENLDFVHLYGCPAIKDLTWLIYVPNLRILIIARCDQIQDARHSKVVRHARKKNLCPLSKLKELVVSDLPELRSICSEPLVLPSLMEISVKGCPKLKRMTFDSNSFNVDKITVRGEKEWWNELQWEDESIRDSLSFVQRPQESQK